MTPESAMTKLPEYARGMKCSTCAHWQGHGWLSFVKQILFVWRMGLWEGWCPLKGRSMWWPQHCDRWEQRPPAPRSRITER